MHCINCSFTGASVHMHRFCCSFTPSPLFFVGCFCERGGELHVFFGQREGAGDEVEQAGGEDVVVALEVPLESIFATQFLHLSRPKETKQKINTTPGVTPCMCQFFFLLKVVLEVVLHLRRPNETQQKNIKNKQYLKHCCGAGGGVSERSCDTIPTSEEEPNRQIINQ